MRFVRHRKRLFRLVPKSLFPLLSPVQLHGYGFGEASAIPEFRFGTVNRQRRGARTALTVAESRTPRWARQRLGLRQSPAAFGSRGADGKAPEESSHYTHLQSQRDCVLQPRVARHSLPWVLVGRKSATPTGLWPGETARTGATPLGLAMSAPFSQGCSCLATLGFEPESLWDSQSSFALKMLGSSSFSIPFQPEELLRCGERMGVRTGRAGNVGEGAHDGGRGLQIETGVGPAQHELVVNLFRKESRRVEISLWNRAAGCSMFLPCRRRLKNEWKNWRGKSLS